MINDLKDGQSANAIVSRHTLSGIDDLKAGQSENTVVSDHILTGITELGMTRRWHYMVAQLECQAWIDTWKVRVAMKKFKNPEAPFKWKHFKGDITLWLVRWCSRFALSYNETKQHLFCNFVGHSQWQTGHENCVTDDALHANSKLFPVWNLTGNLLNLRLKEAAVINVEGFRNSLCHFFANSSFAGFHFPTFRRCLGRTPSMNETFCRLFQTTSLTGRSSLSLKPWESLMGEAHQIWI